MPKSLILRAPGAQLGAKCQATSSKLLQKGTNNLVGGSTWNRLALEIAFGRLLGTVLVDLGWILDEFVSILALILKHFGHILQEDLQIANIA